MRITRIFILGYRGDVHLTRCCVASIRRWYPHIPITLVKDESGGAYDTSDLEKFFGVEIHASSAKIFGWGMGRFEILFQPAKERCLILDSDIVFAGPLLERLEKFDEDFVVEGVNHDPEEIRQNFFDPQQLEELYPPFRYPGYVFNVGQMVATTGILRRDMFSHLIAFEQPPKLLRPDVFHCADQGVLNFVLTGLAQRGEIRIGRTKFMKWAGALKPGDIDLARLANGPPYDFLIHWAGYKAETPLLQPILRYFEFVYRSIRSRGVTTYLP